jgi:transporter family-2 protein
MIFAFVILAIVIGALMPIQAGLNAELTRQLKNPFIGAFVSLTIGAIAVSIFVMFSGGMSSLKRLNEIPPHLFLGGILGAIFVGSSLFFIPRMGATAMMGAFITGQLLGSVIIDHYGLMGLNVSPVSTMKIIGVILLLTGLFLVIKKPA